MPPTAEWERIRPLLTSDDPALQAQAVALLAALGDPWLYGQALAELGPKPVRTAWHGGGTPPVPLVRLDTGGSPAEPCALLRLLADAPPGLAAARWGAIPALRLGAENLTWTPPQVDLGVLAFFPGLRWLELAWIEGWTGHEALEALPELTSLSLIHAGPLAALAGARLERLETALLSSEEELPPVSWPRVARLEVLSESSLALPAVESLPGLRDLGVTAPLSPELLARIARLSRLEALYLHPWTGKPDWTCAPWPPALRRLGLYTTAGLPTAVGRLSTLEELAIGLDEGPEPAPPAPLDLAPLAGLPRLRRLALNTCDRFSAIHLGKMLPALEELQLALGSTARDQPIPSLEFIEDLPNVRRISLRWWYASGADLWERLARLPRLESIQLQNCAADFGPPPDLAARIQVLS